MLVVNSVLKLYIFLFLSKYAECKTCISLFGRSGKKASFEFKIVEEKERGEILDLTGQFYGNKIFCKKKTCV